MNSTKGKIIKYLITVGVGAVAAAIVMISSGYRFDMSPSEQFAIFADAFTVPGVILVCTSLLMWVAYEGIFDMIGYAFGRAATTLVPFMKGNNETFYDYKVKKMEKREGKKAWFLLFVGLGFILIALVFVILYMTV